MQLRRDDGVEGLAVHRLGKTGVERGGRMNDATDRWPSFGDVLFKKSSQIDLVANVDRVRVYRDPHRLKRSNRRDALASVRFRWCRAP